MQFMQGRSSTVPFRYSGRSSGRKLWKLQNPNTRVAPMHGACLIWILTFSVLTENKDYKTLQNLKTGFLNWGSAHLEECKRFTRGVRVWQQHAFENYDSVVVVYP